MRSKRSSLIRSNVDIEIIFSDSVFLFFLFFWLNRYHHLRVQFSICIANGKLEKIKSQKSFYEINICSQIFECSPVISFHSLICSFIFTFFLLFVYSFVIIGTLSVSLDVNRKQYLKLR